ncbi:MAG: hypothetical protein B5M54_05055 [Candidatus Aminicenantes bacterium 4484_214]|nr:MAG: hypothetical protein B5M54_05055 [Candidatus Aminicenantes bacterium 4484_214]RLE08057.1 MAG: hypothetical protein DRJ06_05045 [Candidatus Aminicenantes bacterium]HDJ22504.1 TRAP transporter small permease [Candidatus Aminicenantes bacterium]
MKKRTFSPLEASLIILLIAIVVVTFIQVLFRYFLHFSLGWTEELARFLLLWLASLACAYGFKTKSHFVLKFFVNIFPPLPQKIIKTLVTFGLSLFMGLFIWKALEYTLRVANQTAPSTRVSMAIPYSSAAVGGILMLYYILRNWWIEIRDKESIPISEEDK